MTITALILLAFAMSTDAFAASLTRGTGLTAPRLPKALKMGLIFGCIEGLTPLIGWGLGRAASGFIQAWDHWVAFALLVGIGLHSIVASYADDDGDETQVTTQPLFATVLVAIGTSLDAMAVGVSLAFLDVNIVLAALLIGLATFSMVTIGALLSRTIGTLLGHRAEFIGGLVLISVGCWILYSHLQAG
ncbi:manganese efflux pump MntP [Alteromonas halophila]|uniref:Putative manganese efflux pump MntP n=1 Tax=Alteromonas halophila TaxID=516698 RepID=A0A918JJN7_9ALTE|nr:manganese efflux pump MntP family protein [Alteromonas halophila]GGW84698.1 putative manganese efflux pump MntP [Alteromonas halophila]